MSFLSHLLLLTTVCLAAGLAQPQLPALAPARRERINLDAGWRFALGHASDHNFAAGSFNFLSKAGFGEGVHTVKFDDSAWRHLDLPHDWAVELPFSEKGSASHGSKAIGIGHPENSIGWYRRTFSIPASDLGRRISLEFDGVFRNSMVWVNGHYLGTEQSGYTGFAYNLTEILNYGGENLVVVRVDASLEEGWFYEGAGIYRHVWLTKTSPLHVARNGTFVSTELQADLRKAEIHIRATIANEDATEAFVRVDHDILDPEGRSVALQTIPGQMLAAASCADLGDVISLENPRLWSLEKPALYSLVTILRDRNGVELDRYMTRFGIRSMRWDPNEGFFLNGQPLKIQGTDNHQDHAGVGVAVPDALWDFRIRRLKSFGCNAYRCSHHPPAPELLDACDRLGMLVLDENRLMGTADYHYDLVRRMVLRDRNHPSVMLWSIGNEEWVIEGSDAGQRITGAMQAFVKRLDPTRPVTLAISSGWGRGSSLAIDAAGINYVKNLAKGGFTIDAWHAGHPEQVLLGTEECAFTQTRGIYADSPASCHLRAYDWDPSDWGSSAELGWSQYAQRPYLAGMFVWTGFDYRGEPTPFGWPAISSQFGILDTCGFPKDAAYYFRAWWREEPSLHVFPHWNWSGKEGQPINVWVHSNCEEVELFLNEKSLGRKVMKRSSHLEWTVPYAPGSLLARGYRDGRVILTTEITTTGKATRIVLSPDRRGIRADGADAVVIDVSCVDAMGRTVPTANHLVKFKINGARIIGVGNGDPGSHEADKADQRSLFNGHAQLIVQATHQSGPIHVSAHADGIAPAEVVLSAKETSSDR